MKKIKGPAIFLAQFAGDKEPFNSLDNIAKWASKLGYKGVQIPSWDGRLIDLDKASSSKSYCEEIQGTLNKYSLELTELSTHLQGQLVAVHPAYDIAFDGFAAENVRNNPKARQEWAVDQLMKAATASQNLGLTAHATFSGALAWPFVYPWPQRPAGLVEDAFEELAKRWKPILDQFDNVGVDVCYEIHPGEDLHDGITYEMFLDEKGEKISKSKGNGITIEEWLKYASPESLSLYMYQNPKRAKKLYADVVPKAVDEYLTCIDKFSEQDDKQKLLNPVWHVHNGNPPKEKSIMPFSVLLNLVGTSNATDKDVLWKFIKKNKKDIKVSDHPILDSLVGYALKYFEDIVKSNKKYRKPNDKEKKALQDLVKRLKDCKERMDPEAIQTIVYSVGKDNGYQENLREWFKAIYEIIFGDQDGPRMGFFISFFGIKESIELINKYIK